jgi:hypothetical protein
MAIFQKYLVCDTSSQANFNNWAYGVSSVFASVFTQTGDTGQIMWFGLTITAISVSGSAQVGNVYAQVP